MMSGSRSLLFSGTVCLMLTLTTQLATALPSLPAGHLDTRDVTAQDFKMLAQAATSAQFAQGGKRALLQSTAFSQDFFSILEAILVGNTGTLVVARKALSRIVHSQDAAM